jgi:hypothetical protein
MKLNRRGILGLAAGALAVIGGGTAFAAVSANPSATVTAVTHIVNDADQGSSGNNWAIDTIDRTLTVTVASDQSGVPQGSTRYAATVADAGTFTTLPRALTPNQVILGQRIAHVVSGTLTGQMSYTIVAPSSKVLTDGNVVANLNDGGIHPSGGPQSLSGWPEQAFVPQLPSGELTDGNFVYTYTTSAGESWTDSSTDNPAGGLVKDGNITGLLAPPPVVIRLSHGHGTSTAPTRETVSFQQSGAASWDEFYIVGPGAINGHKGWVNAKVGLNFGYYSGLLANHGYTVYYTPVTSRGSDTQVPGSHGGHVYFVSNR